MSLTLTPQDFERQREYIAALEHTRADLMGVNEELRDKIFSLERGQEDLKEHLQREVINGILQTLSRLAISENPRDEIVTQLKRYEAKLEALYKDREPQPILAGPPSEGPF